MEHDNSSADHSVGDAQKPADGPTTLQRSETVESAIVYPSGTKLALIMGSLYATMFLVALVCGAPANAPRPTVFLLTRRLGPHNYRNGHSQDH